MKNELCRSRLGLGGAALLAIFGCSHCGDDGDASQSPGGAGESPGGAGGTGSSSVGGVPGEAGRGGTEAEPGGSGGAESPPSGGAAGATGIEAQRYGFVFDTIQVPTNNNMARELGFDLSGDDVVDNHLGSVFATFAGQNVESGLEQLVQTGGVILLGALQTTSLEQAASAGFDTFFGTNPAPEPCLADDDCGQHLLGTGSFDVSDEPAGETCAGGVEEGVFSGEGGVLPVRIAFFGQPLDLTLHDARVELTELSEAGFGEGRIGGLVTAAGIEAQLYPGMHTALTASVGADCSGAPQPDCGCVAASSGENALAIYDLNDDCEITLQEVRESTLTAALFYPDIDRDRDGEPDALSFGFGVTGKRATFDVP